VSIVGSPDVNQLSNRDYDWKVHHKTSNAAMAALELLS
jgi:hypothetical protein